MDREFPGLTQNIRALLSAALLFLFSVLSAEAQIPPGGVDEFIESGEISYQIYVSFRDIAWDNPPDTPLPAGKDAADLEELYTKEPTEKNARNFLLAATASGKAEVSDTAYRAVQPILESGKAEAETVLAAVENRKKRGSDGLAYRIATFYQDVYPEEPELYFQAFLLTMNISLQQTIPSLLSRTFPHGEEGKEEKLSSDTLKKRISSYLAAMDKAVHLSFLDKAIELDGKNYQYYLASAGFRSLAKWFSIMGTKMILGKESEEFDLSALFATMNGGEESIIREHLKKALELRPPRDIQAYLAAALYNATLGKFDETQRYSKLAKNIRPDLPDGYDATIFSFLIRKLGTSQPLRSAARGVEEILLEKEARSRADGYDYYVLSSLQKFKLNGLSEEQRRAVENKMQSYAEKSLAAGKSFLGYVALGNSYLLQGETENAVDAYDRAEKLAGKNDLFVVYTDRGIAYLLLGERDRGLSELNNAVIMNAGAEKAKKVLSLYGR